MNHGLPDAGGGGARPTLCTGRGEEGCREEREKTKQKEREETRTETGAGGEVAGMEGRGKEAQNTRNGGGRGDGR